MKQKNQPAPKSLQFLKAAFLLTFLMAEFFGFGSLTIIHAASCTVTTSWDDTNNNPLGGVSTANVGQSYEAVGTYTNCVGMTNPAIGIASPSGGTAVNLGGPIQSSSEQRNAVVKFTQQGDYYFTASVQSPTTINGANVFSSQPSTHIQVLPAVTCSAALSWLDQNGNSFSGTQVSTGLTYSALATFSNCVGASVRFTLFGPPYNGNIGTQVGLGAPISQTTEQRNAKVTFSQAGTYVFTAYATTNSTGEVALGASSSLTASANGSTNPNPNGYALNSKCAYDSDCASTFCDQIPTDPGYETCQPKPAADPSTQTTTTKYACKDGNGVYQCSAGNKSNLSDVTSNTGDCAYDYSSTPAQQVDPSWCGKTDAQIQQTGGNNSATNQTPPAGGTTSNSPANPIDCSKNPDPTKCLYNPLPEDSLTNTLLLIGKGFLGVIAIWAAVFIIIGGFQLVTAAGNEEAILKGKKTITWAVLGLVVALLSFSIIAIVQNLFQANIQPVNTTPATTTQTNPSSNPITPPSNPVPPPTNPVTAP